MCFFFFFQFSTCNLQPANCKLGPPFFWFVRGTFPVCSSHVRPVNRNKCRRAVWNAHMTYKRIRLLPYFYHAEYTNLVWSVYILLAILRRRISGFGTPLLLVQYNIDRDQKNPTICIRGNEITRCVRVRFYI